MTAKDAAREGMSLAHYTSLVEQIAFKNGFRTGQEQKAKEILEHLKEYASGRLPPLAMYANVKQLCQTSEAKE